MVCGMELRHFLEKLEVSAAAIRGKAYIVCFVSFLYRYALRQKGNVR